MHKSRATPAPCQECTSENQASTGAVASLVLLLLHRAVLSRAVLGNDGYDGIHQSAGTHTMPRGRVAHPSCVSTSSTSFDAGVSLALQRRGRQEASDWLWRWAQARAQQHLVPLGPALTTPTCELRWCSRRRPPTPTPVSSAPPPLARPVVARRQQAVGETPGHTTISARPWHAPAQSTACRPALRCPAASAAAARLGAAAAAPALSPPRAAAPCLLAAASR